MGLRIKQRILCGGGKLALCAAIIAAGMATSSAGERTGSIGGGALLPGQSSIYVSVGEQTRPPIGWVEFCEEYKSECNTKPSAPRDVVLSTKAWNDLVKVNSWANDTVKPVTDLEHWGVVERWSYPDDGEGDCEDYVLLKRRILIKAGWPREALLITVVRDKKDAGHAVLTVKTNRGEFILDNQEAQILPWYKTGYRFVKRQSQSDPNVWVVLGKPNSAPAVVSAR